MSDPYALEECGGNFQVPVRSDDLVYPLNRYGYQYTPKCIYIPTL